MRNAVNLAMITDFVNSSIIVRLRLLLNTLAFTASALLNAALAESITVLDWKSWDDLSGSERLGIAPYCSGGYVAPDTDSELATTQPAESILILFNQATIDSEQNGTFSGDVSIKSTNLNASANTILYSNLTQQGTLDGDVIIRLPNTGLSSPQGELNLNTNSASLTNAQFVLYEQDIRGDAQTLVRSDANTLVANQLTFTRCTPSSNAWQLRSSKLTIDEALGIATAWNSRLEIKEIPVLYIPYISFPINDQPRTGLLPPTFGSAWSLPYYFHLAPNYDDTVTPIISTSDGALLRNEFRFLTERHQGINTLDYQIAPSDLSQDARWSIAHTQNGQMTDSLRYDFSTRWVSDQNFDPVFNPGSEQIDFNTAQLTLNQSLYGIQNSLTLDYAQPVIDSTEAFETFDTTFASEKGIWTGSVFYQHQEEFKKNNIVVTASDYDIVKMPEVSLAVEPSLTSLNVETTARLKLTHFSRDLSDQQIGTLSGTDLDLATDVDRIYSSIEISRPFKRGSGYFKPTIEAFASGYQLNNSLGFDLDNEYGSDQLMQLAWRVSIDQGFSVSESGDAFKQTFSPRLHYVYAPLTEQKAPVQDSEIIDNFNLFSNSRFSGHDRIGDMSRLSASLGYDVKRLDSHYDLLNFSIQKGIKLSQERLLESGEEANDNNWVPEFSDWEPSITLRPSPRLVLSASAQIEHDWQATNTYSMSARYNPAGDIFAYLESTKAEDEDDVLLHEIRGGAYFPIRENVALIGYANVNKEANETDWSDFQLENLLYGIEYDNCCWSVRFATLKTRIDNDSALYPVTNKQSYFIEITLKGIGAQAGTIESILNRLDFGYSDRLFNYR